jgi:arylsulfatase A-like enzyme
MTQLLGDRAVQVVNAYAKERRPFFVSLHFNAPHWPWEAPGDEAESQRIRNTALAHYDGGSQNTYQRMITELDTQIGRVVGALRSNGLIDNTIVVFTSDNGGERFADTWPFSGRKTELLEGGLRIPAIVSWPAALPQNRTSQQVAISMDWLPTLLAAAGSTPDPAYAADGMNLLPSLRSGAPVPRRLFWRYKANAQRAMRDGDMKYLKIRENTFLFNVADDPMERANLKDRQRDVFERLSKEWLAWNSTMLPEVPDSNTGGNDADRWADHIGLRSTREPDNPTTNESSR